VPLKQEVAQDRHAAVARQVRWAQAVTVIAVMVAAVAQATTVAAAATMVRAAADPPMQDQLLPAYSTQTDTSQTAVM